ncbi:hypothetical protein NSPZN2_40332 [Nitrospira defluvii]|uniref:Uncharacterized protein n=1 Tax=Nitrospira defluvii TaxID=330214 RepID=A0ABM8RU92_9BACT|nr:hypothetical protein NSPZN2_40332 [Nitrospira defluvii]
MTEGSTVQYIGQAIIHIYRGHYSHHNEYGSGVSIYFNEQVNGKPLSVWIANALGAYSRQNSHLFAFKLATCLQRK